MSMRRLSQPRPAQVEAGPGGKPSTVHLSTVHLIAEDWVIEDRWWTGRPLRRRYFEVVLADGSNIVVFRDLERGRWYSQVG
jgi:hypothetical protein